MAEESPQEKEALEKLDEAAREVAWEEFDKEADRELNTGRFSGSWLRRFGRPRRFHRVEGDPEPEPVDDEDPGDERGLRDVMRDADEKS
jgi:hypothetical protein